MSRREPTLSQLLIDAIQSRLVDLRVMLPAKITAYNSDDQTVDVEILLRDPRIQDDDTIELKDFPPIKQVPVSFVRCGAAWITLPLAVGDTGMLIFADRSLAVWNQSAKGQKVDPKSLDMHNLSGAVFMPGLTPPSSPLDAPDTANVVVHTNTKLDLGEKGLNDTDNLVALAKQTKANDDALLSYINSVKAAVSAATYVNAAGNPTTLVFTSPAAPSLSEVKATKVRAK
jgi:hypothetical protein